MPSWLRAGNKEGQQQKKEYAQFSSSPRFLCFPIPIPFLARHLSVKHMFPCRVIHSLNSVNPSNHACLIDIYGGGGSIKLKKQFLAIFIENPGHEKLRYEIDQIYAYSESTWSEGRRIKKIWLRENFLENSIQRLQFGKLDLTSLAEENFFIYWPIDSEASIFWGRPERE